MARSFNSLPAWLLRTKTGKALQAEAEGEIEDGRDAMAAEIVRLRQEAGDTLPALDETAKTAKTALDRATHAHTQARATYDEAHRIALSTHLSFDSQVVALEGQLRISSDPEIGVCIEALRALWQSTRGTRPEVVEYGDKRWPSGVYPRISNHESIVKKMDAIRAAILEAEALKTATGVDVDARLAEIREDIPGIEEAERFIPLPEEAQPPDPEAEQRVLEKALRLRYGQHPG